MNNILNKNINVLGIETTCDETAAAIVSLNEKGESNLLSNIVHSQYNEHSKFGGIVPEVAARSHLKNISFIVAEAIKQANISNEDLAKQAIKKAYKDLLEKILLQKDIKKSSNCI